ncbi:MAG: hypothetical protein WBP81_30165 [Solirubrobacteraceae bacterium]
MRGPLPQEEFDHIFSRVPRLTVELVIASDDRGVLLALRDDLPDERELRSDCAWFTVLPDNMHDEQKEFLARHLDIAPA